MHFCVHKGLAEPHVLRACPQVQQDEIERQRLQLVKQQMAASGMVSEPLPGMTSAGMTQQMPFTGMLPGHGITPMALSMPSTMHESTTLAGAVSQSAQSLLQHSLSGSLSSQAAAAATATVFGPSSCPDLPQVCWT